MRLSSAGWALTGISAACTTLLAPDVGRLVGDLDESSFPDALVAGASLIVLVLAGWSLVAAAAVLLGGSSRLVRAITPAVLRHVLVAGAAGALAVAPAHAGQLSAPQPSHHPVDGLRLPDRPDVVHAVAPSDAPPSAVVQVRPGDTLWAIAARSLPAGAAAADIAAATRRWHATNHAVIGDDPDRIFPTQRLTPPNGKDHP